MRAPSARIARRSRVDSRWEYPSYGWARPERITTGDPCTEPAISSPAWPATDPVGTFGISS